MSQRRQCTATHDYQSLFWANIDCTVDRAPGHPCCVDSGLDPAVEWSFEEPSLEFGLLQLAGISADSC